MAADRRKAEPQSGAAAPAARPPLPAAAQRALAEAAARRTARAAQPAAAPERNGPAGPDPIRYGDWERKGIASDF
jgi:hypothetical protein